LEVIQIFNLYILLKLKDKVLIFDQHATHEKILFNEYLAQYNSNNAIVNVDPAVKILEESLKEVLLKMNFEFDSEGYIITIPKMFLSVDLTSVLADIKRDLDLYGSVKNTPKVIKKLLSYLACRTAIKAGDSLTYSQMLELVQKALQYDDLYTCPHGRPTHLSLTRSQLDKIFLRTK
jgi:DNA mismatch repair protein MutL